MFGFAQNLQGLNKDFEGFVDESQIQRNPNGFPRNNNYWSLIADGNWNDRNIWMNGGLKANAIPPVNANILIPKGRIITVNQNITVLNFFNKGTVITDETARSITVNGDFISTGATNLSTSNAAHNLILNGVNNFIQSSLFVSGTGSTVTYSRNGDQNVLNLGYRNLALQRVGKNQITNLSIANALNLSSSAVFNSFGFDLTFGGASTSTWDASSFFNKTGGNVIVNGLLDISYCICRVTNTTFEFRNGLTIDAQRATWTGCVFNFTTNNQNFFCGAISFSEGNILEADINITGVTVTFNSTSNIIPVITGVINGTNGSSIMDNRQSINYQNAAEPMATGQLQCNNAANTFMYTRDGAQNVKGITYRILIFGGSGSKTLLGNITCTTFELTGTATINYNGFTITTLGTYIHSGNQQLQSAANVIGVTILFIRTALTLVENRSYTDIIFDSGTPAITFAGFTLTSTGTTSYIVNISQNVFGTANLIVNNLTLGGTATPNNKTLQGNVSVPGVYTVLGNAVRVDDGFTFGNP